MYNCMNCTAYAIQHAYNQVMERYPSIIELHSVVCKRIEKMLLQLAVSFAASPSTVADMLPMAAHAM